MTELENKAGWEPEASEIVGLNGAVGTAQTSTLYSVESREFFLLPRTAAANMIERYMLDFEECWSLVVLLRLIVDKDWGQVDYDEG